MLCLWVKKPTYLSGKTTSVFSNGKSGRFENSKTGDLIMANSKTESPNDFEDFPQPEMAIYRYYPKREIISQKV